MKYLFLLFPILSFSQIINIPDPALKRFLIGPGVGYRLDTNGDGEISQTEALSLINFRTFFGPGIGGVSNVTDFTGLEHFTNLQKVEIFLNQATSLNLENMPNLKELTITGFNSGGSLVNVMYSPIVNLSVTGCTALEKITLSISSVRNLDLTTNTALKNLNAGESKLETVNFSGLQLLEKVEILNGIDYEFFSSGWLQNATFDGNTALKYVRIFNEPNLQALDFTDATSLETLSCRGTGLTTLNIHGLSNLKTVDCDYNQITALDVSGLTSLETINCSYNQIQGRLDFTEDLNIKTIDCSHNLIEEFVVSDEPHQLINVICSFNRIRRLDFSDLGNVFKGLDCSDNLLEEVHVKGTDLRTIDCSNNQLTEIDFEWLQNLAYIDSRNNNIISINMKHVNANPYDGMQPNSEYDHMRFEGNPLMYACVDDFQIDHYRNYFSAKGMRGIDVSATCEFAPLIYPVPVGSVLNIRSGSKIDSFNIYDMNGRLVLSNQVNDNTFSGPISELQTGIYIFEVISNNVSSMIKIIKN